MPRRRTFLERPLDHLALAAATHAAIVAGPPAEDAELEAEPAEETTTPEPRPRRRQAHDSKGRFT